MAESGSSTESSVSLSDFRESSDEELDYHLLQYRERPKNENYFEETVPRYTMHKNLWNISELADSLLKEWPKNFPVVNIFTTKREATAS
ncbi:hypothetical protein ANN_10671 [Periplaneta americana]|uniref:Uncharacterized protein n=1 Tax=Periplaneta americana TaxID=6978 RepID=A0ABQ8T4K7_PERAM|nr:hypothetical protein ANN_10671 [Periplaneta americana]